MRFYRRTCTTHAALLGVVFASVAPFAYGNGDPADGLPSDTLAYVGWRGLIDDTNAGLLSIIPALMESFDANERELETARQILEMVEAVGRGAGALGLLDIQADERVPVSIALVIDPGEHAARVQSGIQRILEQDGLGEDVKDVQIGPATIQHLDRPDGLFWGMYKGRLLVTTTRSGADAIVARLDERGAGLSASPTYRKTRERAGIADHDGWMLTMYADAPRLIAEVKSAAGVEDPTIDKLLRELGVYALDAVTCQMHDVDYGRETRLFIGLRNARVGLLKFWDHPPLTDDELRMIPQNAYWAYAAKCDLAGLWGEARRIVETVAPDALLSIDGGLAMVSAMLGFSPTDDLLPALGDTWIVFDGPDHGGFLFSGAALIVEADDPQALHAIFGRMLMVATPLAAQNNVKLVTKRIEHNGHAIDYLFTSGFPVPIAPAVSYVGNYAVCALSPQVVKVVLDRLDAQGGTILDHADVKEVRARLGKDLQMFAYSDTRYAVRSAYWMMHLIATAFASAGHAGDPGFDPGMLPTLPEQVADVRSGVSGCEATEDGILYVAYGTPAMAAPPAEIAVIALVISILLPSLARARTLAKRTVSMSNLRGIGQAMYIYANDHSDRFPGTLEELVDSHMVTIKQLESPHAPGQIAFEYIPGQTTSSDPRNIIAYERPYSGEGTNALFVDGHVEWMAPWDFESALQKTYERLDRVDEMPSISWP